MVASGKGGYNLLKSSGRFTRALGSLALEKARTMSGPGLYAGSGSYVPLAEQNSLILGAPAVNKPPQFYSVGDETGGIGFIHSEFWGEVYGPGVAGDGITYPFTCDRYSANPGLRSFAPVLSQFAANFEEYEFIQLLYTYIPLVAEFGNAAVGAMGEVLLGFQYNPTNAAFQDEFEMREYGGSVSTKPSVPCIMGVECDSSKLANQSHPLAVRYAPVVYGQDIKTYDFGTLNVATVGVPATYNGIALGRLYLTYNVRLKKMKLVVGRSLSAAMDKYYWSAVYPGSITPAAPWGSSATNYQFLRASQNNIGCSVVPNAPGTVLTVTFPDNFSGPVKVIVYITGTVLTGVPLPAIVANSSIVALSTMYNNIGLPVSNVSTVAANNAVAIYTYYVRPSANGYNNSLTFGAAAGATLTSIELDIYSLNFGGSPTNPMSTAASRIDWVSYNGAPTLPA